MKSPEGAGTARRRCPASRGRSASYPPWDLKIPDEKRASTSGSRSSRSSRRGRATCPALSIIRLGGDHTNGTRPGYPTPRAMIAENDLALGRIVEAISQSRFWKESAIFVLEDDAQNGPDHVDAHRSPALVVSPFAAPRRRQHALHDVRRAAHDGADPRAAADEPVRRGGHADVQRVSGDAGARAVHASPPRACRSTRRTTGRRPAPGRRCA